MELVKLLKLMLLKSTVVVLKNNVQKEVVSEDGPLEVIVEEFVIMLLKLLEVLIVECLGNVLELESLEILIVESLMKSSGILEDLENYLATFFCGLVVKKILGFLKLKISLLELKL